MVDQRLTAYRFVIAGFAALLGFSVGLSFFAVSPITPVIIDEYGINRSSAGLLISLVFFTHAVFTIPSSMLAARVKLKKLIAVGWLLSAAPALSFTVESFSLLLTLRIIYGLGFALIVPALGPLIMQWFRPKELPVANGVLIAFMSLGTAISSFAVVPISESIGWRGALSVFGCVTLLSAVCWLLLGRAQGTLDQRKVHFSVGEAWQVLRSRNTLLLAAADAGPYALLTAALAWLPTFYHEAHGMSLAKAGGLMGLLSLSGVAALVLSSLLPLRVRSRRPFLIFPGILAGFAGFGSFLLADSPMVYVAVLALGFATWFYLPVLMTIPMELPRTSPSHVSLIFAAIVAVGSTLNFVSPLTVGAMTDLIGSYLPGLALFAVLSWSLAIGGVLLPETGAVKHRAG